MLSSLLTSLYHIVRAAGGIARVCNAGLQILLLQLLIGVKLLFWPRHKYLTLLGIIVFDTYDRHPPRKVVHSWNAPSARRKQRNAGRLQRGGRGGVCLLRPPVCPSTCLHSHEHLNMCSACVFLLHRAGAVKGLSSYCHWITGAAALIQAEHP